MYSFLLNFRKISYKSPSQKLGIYKFWEFLRKYGVSNYVFGCFLWSLVINFGYYYHYVGSSQTFFRSLSIMLKSFSIFQKNPTLQKSIGKKLRFGGSAFISKLSEQKIGIFRNLGRGEIAGILGYLKPNFQNFSVVLKFLTFLSGEKVSLS